MLANFSVRLVSSGLRRDEFLGIESEIKRNLHGYVRHVLDRAPFLYLGSLKKLIPDICPPPPPFPPDPDRAPRRGARSGPGSLRDPLRRPSHRPCPLGRDDRDQNRACLLAEDVIRSPEGRTAPPSPPSPPAREGGGRNGDPQSFFISRMGGVEGSGKGIGRRVTANHNDFYDENYCGCGSRIARV